MQKIGFGLSRLLIGALIIAQIGLSFTVFGENIARHTGHHVIAHLDTALGHNHVSAPEFVVTDQAEQHDHQSYASSLDLSHGVSALAGQQVQTRLNVAVHVNTLPGTNHPLFRPPRNSPVNG